MATGIVLLSFLPFLYYATKDTLFHFRGRKVSLAEHLLHLAIGCSLVIVVANAVRGAFGLTLAGLVFFAVAGALDEYVWHRNIPEEESDLHAKEHLALLLFVVVVLVVRWLEQHNWQLPSELSGRIPTYFRSETEPPEPAVFAAAPSRPWWRAVVIPMLLAPYAWFGLHDNLHHIQRRIVPWTERILHAAIVLALFTVIPQAMFGRGTIMLAGLSLFLVARVLDEWLFHRNLPEGEAALHARTHFAFLAFLIFATNLDYWTQRGWT